MELTKLERAKRWMKESACKAAMVALPLAVAVPHASAGPILPTGNATCQGISDLSNPSCASSIIVSSLPSGPVTGVQFTSVSGGITINHFEPANNDDKLLLSAGGMLTGGTLSGVLPVSFSFTLAANEGVLPSSTWGLMMELGSSGSTSNFGFLNFSGSTSSFGNPTIANGSGNLAINGNVTAGTAIFETIVLTVPVIPNSFINVKFPFSFGSVASTPEPASLGLTGGALGLLGWLLRRRRKTS